MQCLQYIRVVECGDMRVSLRCTPLRRYAVSNHYLNTHIINIDVKERSKQNKKHKCKAKKVVTNFLETLKK